MSYKTELSFCTKAEIAASSLMYHKWFGEHRGGKHNSPIKILKDALGMELDIDIDGHTGKVSMLEMCMLKLVEKATRGDLNAINTIIKEVEHGGVEKHQYVDGLPDDVKFLYKDVTFTDITGNEAPDIPTKMIEVSKKHKDVVVKKEQHIEELINSWG